jgi:acyl-CoA synthetase (AMP-forming)/AMP-acid ligase II
MGERVKAFVVLKEPGSVTDSEIKAFCAKHMADYKVPRHVQFVEDFPRTTTGKIQRFVLQQQAREQLAAQAAGIDSDSSS